MLLLSTLKLPLSRLCVSDPINMCSPRAYRETRLMTQEQLGFLMMKCLANRLCRVVEHRRVGPARAKALGTAGLERLEKS